MFPEAEASPQQSSPRPAAASPHAGYPAPVAAEAGDVGNLFVRDWHSCDPRDRSIVRCQIALLGFFIALCIAAVTL